MNDLGQLGKLEEGVSFLLEEYRSLRTYILVETSTFRIVGASLIGLALILEPSTTYVISLFVFALLLLVLWTATNRLNLKLRIKLEEVLSRILYVSSSEELTKAYVEWRHKDWGRGWTKKVLSLEPTFWTVGSIVIALMSFALARGML